MDALSINEQVKLQEIVAATEHKARKEAKEKTEQEWKKRSGSPDSLLLQDATPLFNTEALLFDSILP